jgi:hypothetical protein
MAHAGLCPRDIVIKIMAEDEPALAIIDSDGLDLADEVRYPLFLNEAVPWTTGAKVYQKVGEDNDRILLDNWWDGL